MSRQLNGFTIRPYRTHRLDEYCKNMSTDHLGVCYDPNVAAALKAQGYSWDETPRSIYRVDKLYEALSKYEPGLIPNIDPDVDIQHGISLARACFAKPKTQPVLEPLPLTFNTVVDLTSNPDASAGLTAWGLTKQEAMLNGLERGIEVLKGSKAPEPCLAFSRTQFNDKTRLVWGYPYDMTIIEGLLARPLIDQFKNHHYTPMAFGMSSHTLGSRLRVAARHCRYAYSLDMSAYDASISAKLIHISFGILKTWFDLSQVEPITGVKYGKIFDKIEDYFIKTPIVMPDHKLYLGKRHGVPSGSYFTQMIDSIVNVIICGTISSRFDMNVSKREIFVLGDDLLLWTNRNVDLEKIASYANNLLHVNLNSKKSTKNLWSEPVHYLGRVWTNGVPDQSLDQIIARMVYPERKRKYSDDPIKREREVNLLCAAMAANYKSANGILKKVLGTKTNRISPKADDAKLFGHGEKVNPQNLSGLTRYKMIYEDTDKGAFRWPTQLVRMWID